MGIVDSSTLIRAKREIETPFELRIRRADGELKEIKCKKILRLLPGKRIVALAEVDGQDLLVKIFLGRTSQRYIDKEQKGVEHILSAGVRTPQLYWLADLTEGAGQVIAFEYISASVSLQQRWDQAQQDDARIDILTRAMIIIAKLHNQGVVQTDIHLDNFLMSEKRIYTIDGGGVVRKGAPPLQEQESINNLSMFFAQMFPKYDEFAQMVMPAYEAIRGWKPDPVRLTKLHESIFKSRDIRKKNYLEKAFRDCTRFCCQQSFSRFVVCEREQHDAELADIIERPDEYMKQGEVLKAGNTATVVLIKTPTRSLVIKRYNIKNLWHGISRAFQMSRAWKSWFNAFHMEFLGIRSLKPLAMIEHRFGPLRNKAYFITEYVEAPDALDFLPTVENPSSETEALAMMLRNLSDSRIAHGDLKATNFLMAEEGPVIIDLDAMREYKNDENFERAFNRDLARFMKNWEDQPDLTHRFEDLLAKLSS